MFNISIVYSGVLEFIFGIQVWADVSGVKFLNPGLSVSGLDRSSQDGRFGEAVCVWIVHLKTGEAVISEKKVTVEIAKVLDLIWLANLREAHLKKLRRLPLKYNEEDRVLADQFIKVVQFCVKNKVWAGSSSRRKDEDLKTNEDHALIKGEFVNAL